MELAMTAMTPLIEKLGELLLSELTLGRRVREDVASLQMELKAMHLALQRVQVPPDRIDAATAEWAANVRDLAYDMEDAIDVFTLHVGEDDDRRGNWFRGLLDKTARLFSWAKGLHQVAGAISEARRLTKELGEINQRYAGLKRKREDIDASPAEIDPRLSAMFTEAADLVGINGVRDELIKHLSDPSEVDVKTLSIVGFGGLGKTTLAKAVYDKIKGKFDCWAFVSVSQNPDMTRIFKKILFELDKERYANINEAVRDVSQLINELKDYLQSKRYLIVVDDLWDERSCSFIKGVFPKNTSKSRLIMTTRNYTVSEEFCNSEGDIIHSMKPLSDDDSLRLFCSRIFHRGDSCPSELEQVSRDILKKCGGVPLAIITIASLLASGRQVKTKDQWLRVLHSIGHGLKGCWKVEDMHTILSLSYYDLPPHLKPCLLYLAIFPEDDVIDKGRLIWRWIAEGFIQRDNIEHGSLFEIGENYFIDLLNRSLIQSAHIDPEGRATAGRVHDMVLDLIRSLSSKEKFITVWDKGEQATSSHSMAVARRLSIQNNTITSQTAITSMSKLRSFTIFNPAINSMPSLTQFQVVRVLDLEDCDLRKCGSHLNLRHVGKLSHLRYLGLRRTHISELPAEVGKLQFLQTLDIRDNRIPEFLRTITGLRNLMRLRLDWKTSLKRLGNLTSLEELRHLNINCDNSAAIVKELGQLTRLRDLKMCLLARDIEEAFVQSLRNLNKLQRLHVFATKHVRGDLLLDWVPPSCLHRFTFYGTLASLPVWMKSTSWPLTYLNIQVCQVGLEDLQALGTLPLLRFVCLYATNDIDAGCSPVRMEVKVGAFPCARTCRFVGFATVPSMFPPGAMPLVQQLQFSIRAWHFAEGGGFGLDDLRMGHLPSLEEVNVELRYREEDDATVVERVEAALRETAEDHPNRLDLRIGKRISRLA